MHKHEKRGPELFLINAAMVTGLETLAGQFKKIHDHHNSDFLMAIKTGLSKTLAVTPEMNKMSVSLREQAKAMIALADWIEQLFPEVKE